MLFVVRKEQKPVAQQHCERHSFCLRHAIMLENLGWQRPSKHTSVSMQSASLTHAGVQLRVPPQPSEIVPQDAPRAAHVARVQPQTFAVPPPPQVSGAVQVPQSMVPPQPSDREPHSAPCPAQVVSEQQVPNEAPGGMVQNPLQQLWWVRHSEPAGLQVWTRTCPESLSICESQPAASAPTSTSVRP
jgi:hypothetical protein